MLVGGALARDAEARSTALAALQHRDKGSPNLLCGRLDLVRSSHCPLARAQRNSGLAIGERINFLPRGSAPSEDRHTDKWGHLSPFELTLAGTGFGEAANTAVLSDLECGS